MPRKSEPAAAGHNSDAALRSFVERVENVEGEIAALSEDRKDIFGEAKAAGLNVKALKKVIAIRKKDQDKWLAEENAVDEMLLSLGML